MYFLVIVFQPADHRAEVGQHCICRLDHLRIRLNQVRNQQAGHPGRMHAENPIAGIFQPDSFLRLHLQQPGSCQVNIRVRLATPDHIPADQLIKIAPQAGHFQIALGN